MASKKDRYLGSIFSVEHGSEFRRDQRPVSYTHLDVYKRQEFTIRAINRNNKKKETGAPMRVPQRVPLGDNLPVSVLNVSYAYYELEVFYWNSIYRTSDSYCSGITVVSTFLFYRLSWLVVLGRVVPAVLQTTIIVTCLLLLLSLD